jgi:hypothetical protein
VGQFLCLVEISVVLPCCVKALWLLLEAVREVLAALLKDLGRWACTHKVVIVQNPHCQCVACRLIRGLNRFVHCLRQNGRCWQHC